jgi:hypothetical protein
MPSLKGPTVAGTLAWGGVLLGFLGSLLFAERPGRAEPQAAPAGSAAAPGAASGKGGLPPLPASSASSPASSAPPASSAAPGAAPPPYMYQEPWTPPSDAQRSTTGGPLPSTVLPAPYVYELPPPAPPMHRSPYASLFVGARAGALFPFGHAYATGRDYYSEYGEDWAGLATGGPLLELDVGVRFARHFTLYGFWEHAWMGKGSDPSWRAPAPGSNFGNQQSATTDYPGLGFRWSSRPSSVGFLIDLGLGYRWFHESWSSGAKMDFEGFGEFRLGLGADIRVTRLFSLTPLMSVSTGSFSDRQVTIPGEGKRDIANTFSGSHGTLTLSVGGNFDLFATDN